MARNDLKAYTTVLARLPQDLADQVKQYAMQHRCTVSELIRDGLEMRLDAGEVPGRSTGHSRDAGGEVIHEVLQVIPEVIQRLSPMLLAQMQDMIRTTVTEVLQGNTSLPQPHTHGMPSVFPVETPSTAPLGKGMTEVLPIEPTLTPVPQMTEGHTSVIPLVPTPQQHTEGITEVIPNTLRGMAVGVPIETPSAAPTVEEPALSSTQGMTEVLQEIMPPLPATAYEGMTANIQTITQPAPEVLPGNTSTPQAHAPSTEGGMTAVLHDKADFDATRFALGKLCVNRHEYQDSGETLYRLPKYVCPQCDAARARERRARLKGQGRT